MSTVNSRRRSRCACGKERQNKVASKPFPRTSPDLEVQYGSGEKRRSKAVHLRENNPEYYEHYSFAVQVASMEGGGRVVGMSEDVLAPSSVVFDHCD